MAGSGPKYEALDGLQNVRISSENMSGDRDVFVLPSKRWKPYTLRLPFLITLFLITIGLIIFIEVLKEASVRNNGLIFAVEIDKLPLRLSFPYLYLPTIVAVFYGILWTLVDLDVKRLEPFFELSRPGGSSGKALFLEYSYEFSYFIPYRSIRRKHWAVFMSSTAYLIAFLFVTPLTSSLIVKDQVTLISPGVFRTNKELGTLTEQQYLSMEFLLSANDVEYTGAPMPAFTTADFAALPVEFRSGDGGRIPATSVANDTWTVKSTAFTAEMECEPITMEYLGPPALWGIAGSLNEISTMDNCKWYANLTFPGDEYWDYFISHNLGVRINSTDQANGYYTIFSAGDLESEPVTLTTPRPVIVTISEPASRTTSRTTSRATSRATSRTTSSTTSRTTSRTNSATASASASATESEMEPDIVISIQARDLEFTLEDTTLPEFSETTDPERMDIQVFYRKTSKVQWTSYGTGDDGNSTFYRIFVTDLCNYTKVFVFSKTYQGIPRLNDTEVTAVGCRSKYYTMEPELEVSAGSGSVLRVLNDTNELPKTPLGNDTYDPTRFETYALSDPTPQIVRTPDIIIKYIVDYLHRNVTNYDDLLLRMPSIDRINWAFRLLFAQAVRYVFEDVRAENDTTQYDGSMLAVREAYSVSPLFSALLEAFLSVTALFCLVLMVYYTRRTSPLLSDPDSISAAMALVADSQMLVDFQGLDKQPTKVIRKRLESEKYCLAEWKDADGRQTYGIDREYTRPQSFALPMSEGNAAPEPPPTFLRLRIGVLLLTIVASITGFLCFLYTFDSKYDGLPPLSSNNIVFQIIWSFIPTVVAALTEISWATIYRDLCVLQPFINLFRGNVPAWKSLSQKYASIPPQIVVFRALRMGDILLGLVTLMLISTNVLSIAFSGMFNVDFGTSRREVQLQTSFQPILNSWWDKRQNFTAPEMYQHARANLTERRSLTPWTSKEYAFLPFTVPESSSQDSAAMVVGKTAGVGTTLECRDYNEIGNFTLYFDSPDQNLSWPGVALTYYDEAAHGFCYFNNSQGKVAIEQGGQAEETGIVNGAMYDFKSEVKWDVPRPNREFDLRDLGMNYSCHQYLVVVQMNVQMRREPAKTTQWTYYDQPEVDLLACTPSAAVKEFEVTVDIDGSLVRRNEVVAELDSRDQDGFFGNGNGTDRKHYLEDFTGILQNTMDLFQGLDIMEIMFSRVYNVSRTGFSTTTEFGEAASFVYGFLFTQFLGAHIDSAFLPLASSDSGTTITATLLSQSRRVTVTFPLFVLAVVLLGLFWLVGIWVYTRRRQYHLPRQPMTLGGMLGYLYASRVLDDVKGTQAMSTSKRAERLEALGRTYGFGWFRGRDGGWHYGIDREPLVREV